MLKNPMKFIRPCFLALLTNPYLIALAVAPLSLWASLGVLLAVPVAVLVAVPFARWDTMPSTDSAGVCPTLRGDLPRWASWLGTPNERLPGGTYEPAVASVLERFGRSCCAWYWLAMRNQLYGLSAVASGPISGPWPSEPGYYENGDYWWLRRPILWGRLTFKAGYRAYFVNGAWIAVPALTITKP